MTNGPSIATLPALHALAFGCAAVCAGETARAQQSPPQESVVITVTSVADSGPGTLRDAMERARTDLVPTTIRFAVGGDVFIQTGLPAVGDMQNPTTIDGSSAPSRIRIRSAPGFPGSAMFVVAPNNVFRSFDFYDVDFDMVSLFESADGNLFEDVAFSNCRRGIGLLMNGGDFNRFVRCRMENNASAGIYCIDGCDYNQFGPGLRVGGNPDGGILLRTGRGNVIAGTASEPVDLQGNSIFAIALSAGSTQNIVGPFVRISGGTGTAMRIGDPVSSFNVVQDTVVTGVAGHAFSIGNGAHHNLLWRCTADAATDTGILFDRLATQNVALECTVGGRAGSSAGLIALTDSPSNRLLSCTVFGRGTAGSTLNPYGVTLVRSRSCEITDGDFTNLQNYAIGLASGSDLCLLVDNRVNASGGTAPALGISVQGGSGAEVVGALLVGNTLDACRAAGASFSYAVDSALVGNTISAASNTGVRVNDAAQRIDLRDNAISGPSSAPAGVSLDGSRDVRLFGNGIRGFSNGVNAGMHSGDLVCDANRFLDCRQVGLSLLSARATVTNNLFDSCDFGVSTQNATLSGTRLVHNTFVYNRIGHNGGGEIWNSIFWFNTQQDIASSSLAYVNLRNNDLQSGNPRIGSNGNVSATPPFVSPTSITGNFHLQNVSTPLIQGGSAAAPGLPSRDVDGQTRISGAAPDMGMDEVR